MQTALSIEKVQKLVAGVRREAKAYYDTVPIEEDEKGHALSATRDAELDTLSRILFCLETCQDGETAQRVTAEIFNRVKTLWSQVPKKDKDKGGGANLIRNVSVPNNAPATVASGTEYSAVRRGGAVVPQLATPKGGSAGASLPTLKHTDSAPTLAATTIVTVTPANTQFPPKRTVSEDVMRGGVPLPLANSRPLDQDSRKKALDSCTTAEERRLEAAHQEWDDEIVRLNKTVEEKVARMNARKNRGGGGRLMVSQQQLAPPTTQPTSNLSPNSLQSPRRKTTHLRASASFVPLSPRSNAEASVFNDIQLASFVSKASNCASQAGRILNQYDLNPETLSFTIRDMVLNAKSAADLMSQDMRGDKDTLLDACRLVLGKASAFVTSPNDSGKKLDLIGVVISFVEILNTIENKIGQGAVL